MVTEPDQVKLESSWQSSKLMLKLRVAPKEIGKVIGKQGQTARAFRQILGAIGMTHNVRIILDIDESHAQTAVDIDDDLSVHTKRLCGSGQELEGGA